MVNPTSSKKNAEWQIQQAKTHFSEMINKAQKGVQIITKNGVPIAVVLSKKEFDKINKPKKSIVEFFKESPCPDIELDIQRSKDLPREIEL